MTDKAQQSSGFKSLQSKAFTQGYACAVANYIRMHGCDTPIEETWRDGVGSLKNAREANVDPFDMEILEKHFK